MRKRIGLASIGIFLLIILATSVVKIKAEVQNGNNIEVLNNIINEKDKYYSVELNIPAISGLGSKPKESEINSLLEKKQKKFKNEIVKMAIEDGKYAEKNNIELSPYEAVTKYKVNYNSKNILSLTLYYYQFTGGAHGNTAVESINLNATTGENIQLKDIFKKGINYKKIINEKIVEEMKKKPDDFFQENINNFSGIKNNQEFYFTDGGFVVYFQTYEIAPYAAGNPEFVFKFQDYKDSIKPEYL
ncbi:MAG: DUF3298 and DUF4163 domain-containing protein [Clostridiaceae bacterium]